MGTSMLVTRSFCNVSVLDLDSLTQILEEYPGATKQIYENASKQLMTKQVKAEAVVKNLQNKKVQRLLQSSKDNEKDPFILLDPHSRFSQIWNFLILIIICFNAIDLPYSIVFLSDTDETTWDLKIYIYSSYILDFVFMIDIYLHYCRFNFETNGVVNTDPLKIKERFMSEWESILDFIAV